MVATHSHHNGSCNYRLQIRPVVVCALQSLYALILDIPSHVNGLVDSHIYKRLNKNVVLSFEWNELDENCFPLFSESHYVALLCSCRFLEGT